MIGLLLAGVATFGAPQVRLPAAAAGVAVELVQHLRKNKGRDIQEREDSVSSREPGGAPHESAVLNYKDVRLVVTKKVKGAGKQDKVLLNGVTGVMKPGRLTAIMGASGAGKSTLLNVLAGQLPYNAKAKLTGSVTLNGRPLSTSRHKLGYVRQFDIFYPMLTVKETLMLAAQLQLPTTMTTAEKEAYVDTLIGKLGLRKCAATRVGDKKTPGISGGERKRLNIGVELLGNPKLILADEPTTGLDTFQAEQVMSTLHGLAEAGHTVVVAIHQPRSSIWDKFDDVVLLFEGRTAYAGPTSEVLAWFAAQGHACPPSYNPAEYVIDLISVDFSSKQAEDESRARIAKLIDAFDVRQANPASAPGGSSSDSTGAKPAGATASGAPARVHERGCQLHWPAQFRLLFVRAWRQVTRDKSTNVARAMVSLWSALIFGSVYWRMGRSQTSIQDRMGLLQVGAINTAMASLTKTLTTFSREKITLDQERSKSFYSLLPYFLAKVVAEAPVSAFFPLLFAGVLHPMSGMNNAAGKLPRFLGLLVLESFSATALGLALSAASPSPDAALAFGPAVMVIFIIFGGYYVNADNVPRVLRGLPNASLVRWAFQGLCVNEFKGLNFEASAPGDTATGEQVLERLSFGHTSIPKTAVIQGRIMLAFYALTFYILAKKEPKYQQFEK